MIIDTRKTVLSIQLRRVITLFATLVTLIAIILLGKLPNTFLGYNKYQWSVLVASLYVLSIIVESLFEFRYIYFNDQKDRIILRYFSLSFFLRIKKSIEIPKKDFVKYEMSFALFGRKPKIILHSKIKGVDAKFPEVSLSILKKQQLSALKNALKSYSK